MLHGLLWFSYDTWADYNTLLTLLAPSSSQAEEVQRALQILKPRVEEAQKQEMGEMVDKLKGLGNKILGKSLECRVARSYQYFYR